MWFLLFLLATRPYASSLTITYHRATTAVGGVLGELDVLLGVHVHHERGRVHHLLTHADVSLLNQLAGVVDRLRQTELEHLRLQSAVHQLGGRQLQNGVQLLVLLGDEAQAGHAADDGSALEDSAGIRLLQRQQFTSSLAVTPFALPPPCGSWRARAAHAKSHACCADRIHRKYAAPGPDARARRGDGEC